MATHFIRNDGYGCGMGSNLQVICVALDNIKFEGEAFFTINTHNVYNCSWNDLFDQTKPGEKTIDLMSNSVFWKNPIFNKPNFLNEDLNRWNIIYKKHIHLKSSILEKIDFLTSKYKINEVTCLYFRGTDKQGEIPRVSYDRYLSFIPPEGALWIQSDELAFVNFMKDKYPGRAFSISEFTFREGNLPFHRGATMNDAIEALSIMYLMSRSKQIIANISSMVHVALIIRGNNSGYTCVQ